MAICASKEHLEAIVISQDNIFDEIVGTLEGILLSDEFQQLKDAFFEKHAGSTTESQYRFS